MSVPHALAAVVVTTVITAASSACGSGAGGPSPAPLPPGTTQDNAAPLESATVSAHHVLRLSGTSGSADVSFTVPPGALPAGSTVTEESVTVSDFRRPPGTSLLSGFGLSWRTPADTQPAASIPISMTIKDPGMARGDILYLIGPDDGLVEQVPSTPEGVVRFDFVYVSAYVVDDPNHPSS